jgi:DNA-binding MurR/RpiR family transcriptional regulator
VYLIASGSAFSVACYLAYALSQMRVHSVLVDGIGGMLSLQAGHATSRDVVVAIAPKAHSAELVEVVRESKKRGVPTIVLANSRVNPFSKHADVMLEAPQSETAGFPSLATTMTLALTLVVGVGNRLESKRDSRTTAPSAARRLSR